jgi:hypothetical protein
VFAFSCSGKRVLTVRGFQKLDVGNKAREMFDFPSARSWYLKALEGDILSREFWLFILIK